MLLGLLSDTHLRTPERSLLALLAGPLGNAEVLLHAGDLTGPGVWEHLEYGEPRPCHCVAGNCDPQVLAGVLPARRVLDLDGLRVGLIHGWGAPAGLAERVLAAFPGPLDLLVFGHSHRPEQRRMGSTLLVNPGSALQARGAGCSLALVDTGVRPLAARFLEVGS